MLIIHFQKHSIHFKNSSVPSCENGHDCWSQNWKRRFFKRPEIGFEAREDSKLMAVMVANAKIFLYSFTFRKEGYK